MKNITIPELALKTFGLVLVVIGLPQLPWMVYSLILLFESTKADVDTIAPVVRSLSGIFYIVLGFTIFGFSRRLAQRFLAKNEQTSELLTPQVLQDTLFSCVGLFVALQSIPAVVSLVVTMSYFYHHNIDNGPNMMETTIGIGAAITFIIGVIVFLGAHGLVGFRDYIRNLGMKKRS